MLYSLILGYFSGKRVHHFSQFFVAYRKIVIDPLTQHTDCSVGDIQLRIAGGQSIDIISNRDISVAEMIYHPRS